MANTYITAATRKKLDYLAKTEKRSISLQIEFLCDERMKQLIPHHVKDNPSLESKAVESSSHPQSMTG